MVGSPVLVDSSYYINALREGRDPLRALAVTAVARDLVICGVVRCEVGRGLRDPRTLEKFQAFWNVMINAPTDNHLWEDVEKMAWQLDRQGIVLPLTDIIIAGCAVRTEAVVLTYDLHFYNIPNLKVISQLES